MAGDNIDDNSFEESNDKIHDILPVSGMYENWFLEYASYVILERAVPAVLDGFKPVQRRILHSMKEMDDGRFNKVANVIGNTMQYHPHGDAAIGDAIVNLGQKDLLIETQGNWGDVRTGDGAAAPRYIEARLSKFANHVVFNPQTTEWQASYDGRKKEPITLPVKFPMVLAQGVEGIAVGLATKILPHNFIELIDASIKCLQGKKYELFPDFITGGKIDVSNYNDGLKGSRVRIRADIKEFDKKTLHITSIPFGSTTTSIIESIIKANDSGKIKVKKVVDNTAKDVEIEVHLAPGTSPDVMIDALYAFTDCEASVSPNCCVIIAEKPHFIGVTEILQITTDSTVRLLKRELEIRRAELMEKLLFSSLEKIFIQEEMYINFKNYDNKHDLFIYLDNCFEPFKPQFYREINDEDFEKLTQIPMIRITRFDTDKADEKMRNLQEELDKVNHNLANLVEYAINYFLELKEKFGKGRERKCELTNFETINANIVAANNAKLYVNREEGFVGMGMKKDEFICDCSDIDDIIVIRKDGHMLVSKITDKAFVGKDILYVGVFKKNDERMVYNLIYLNGENGATYIKRFQVLAVTRDREYPLVKGNKKSKVLYLTDNPNGEAEVVTTYLTSGCSAKKKVFDFDFSEIAIKGRAAGGNILTKYPVRRVQLKSKGVSTLAGLKIWFDEHVGRINRDERGTLLGEFNGDDSILVFYKNGEYELTNFELTNKYETAQIIAIEKFNPKKVVSVIYYDGDHKTYFVKRFQIETSTIDKRFNFISESSGSKLEFVSTQKDPRIELTYTEKGKKEKETAEYSLVALIDVKGWKAMGNKFLNGKIHKLTLVSKEEIEQQEDADEEEEDDSSESFNAGSSIDLSEDKDDKKEGKDQLGLF